MHNPNVKTIQLCVLWITKQHSSRTLEVMKLVSILVVILGLYFVKDVNAKPNPAVQSIVKPNTPENRKPNHNNVRVSSFKTSLQLKG